VSRLPSGTVTFLYTDIEGSTRRWEEQPTAMRVAVDRHFGLLRRAVESHGGHVFRTQGDGLCAAFTTAPSAVAAALDGQLALGAQAWPGGAALRVRMAVHSGAADVQDGDYVGACLNRVGRLLAIGHGGQTLLSRTTYDLVREAPPAGARLRDLGEHRLRDLATPEQVFQLQAEGLIADFPPLASLDSFRTNLPAQATPFVGREREAAAVRERLARPDVRLLTLTGPGGTGKTRLALAVAAEAVDRYADGVFFVGLDPIRDPALVLPTVARTLGLAEVAGQSALATLAEHLRYRQMLLVLDNFEQVLAAGGGVAQLAAACPRVKVLATSRVLLRLYGEHEYQVPPMALPDPLATPPVERLGQYDAVRLFAARAEAARRGFAVTSENAQAVVEICHRLDGLPLAIELAAARARVLPLAAILARLEHRLTLLVGGARDLPARQQTLRQTIAWSYDLLDEAEQALLRRLAVFVGGFTLEAAEVVADPDDLGFEVVEGIGSLVDNSLLRQDDEADREPRFRMLETLREFSLERLELRSEAEQIRQRHAAYFATLVDQAEPELSKATQGAWLERLERDHDNIRRAMAALVDQGRIEGALQMAANLRHFWDRRGHHAEARQLLDMLLGLPAAAGRTAARAGALNGAGILAADAGDEDRAAALFEESGEIRRELGDQSGLAKALNNLGALAQRRGDYAAARRFFGEALAIKRSLDDAHGVAQCLTNEALVASLQGEYTTAEEKFREALDLSRETGSLFIESVTLLNWAFVAIEFGDEEEASERARAALAIWRKQGYAYGTALVLEALVALAARRAKPYLALQLAGAAQALHETLRRALPKSEQERLDRYLERVWSSVNPAEGHAAWAAGRAMQPDEAIALAVASEEALEAPTPSGAPTAGGLPTAPGRTSGNNTRGAPQPDPSGT
jgi:predicted ATPase/class 3 adenylate cyclase